MKFHYEQHGNIDLVALSGQLVMANASEIREALKPIIEAGQGKLILNLADVNFMDSSGLSVLISALKAIREKQGEVVLTQITGSVQALIELTQLHQVFKLFADDPAALAYFQNLP
ncbi:Putative anti-sigma factor antagonist [Candidatus Venteria ishoeyi]|uniref:Anti-sigma factor antagonist n=2 Tax=Candidatus Venteria ishoeyi TaxID=1899563 RepID=A0A1H6FAK0_9GAMM|nr:Putative anti-sigma factor antagonist [Candidatus Venteria ishoeyi]